MSFFVPFYTPVLSTVDRAGGGGSGGTCRNSGSVDPGSIHHDINPEAEGGQSDRSTVARGGSEGSTVDFQGCKSIITSQDMVCQAPSENCNGPCSGIVTIAVAIDKDKNSPHAVRWAVDNLAVHHPSITLIHVKRKIQNDHAVDGHPVDKCDPFSLYRAYCARKGVQLNEVIIEENDVSKALLEYIANNYITSMVLGASTRNALSRKLKSVDISHVLAKSSPDFCSIFVISKGKVTSVKQARRSVVNTATPPRTPTSVASLNPAFDKTDPLRGVSTRTRRRSTGSEFLASEKKINELRVATAVDRNRAGQGNLSVDNLDIPTHGLRSPSRDSTSDFSDSEFSSPRSFRSMDLHAERFDFSGVESDSPRHSSVSQSSREIEAEMRRLKLELKQTMDLYSSACKEAISAKKKAAELQQLKMEEARKFEEARLAQEAALAMAEVEKAKCKAAIEAAEKAQKIAEIEAERRRQAELKAQLEAKERDRALSALHHNDIRYRKYTLAEIEEATDNFSDENKIGEGGYGPVYKGIVDHTPVAIKVLRPDADHEINQFHQEVEILCCMRHPNMVLLLGACPENGCLVYEYMDYGNLEDRLFQRGGTPPISLRKRFKIAVEIATALLFLHQAKPEPLMHRDLRPANILLDRNYKSKISDVGLSRLVPPSVMDSVTQYHMTRAVGTFCYIDPEYQQTGKLTTKSDVYSLGILLLQMITAKPPMGLTHQVRTAIERGKFEELLDPAVREWPKEEALAIAELALKCTLLQQKDRPDLGTVVLPELNRLRHVGRNSNHRKCSGYSTPKSQGPSSPVSIVLSETGFDQTYQDRHCRDDAAGDGITLIGLKVELSVVNVNCFGLALWLPFDAQEVRQSCPKTHFSMFLKDEVAVVTRISSFLSYNTSSNSTSDNDSRSKHVLHRLALDLPASRSMRLVHPCICTSELQH